jgi:hypothetical protein
MSHNVFFRGNRDVFPVSQDLINLKPSEKTVTGNPKPRKNFQRRAVSGSEPDVTRPECRFRRVTP